MKYATIDHQSDVQLVATILGKRTDDEACARLAAVLTTDGWTGGSPLSDCARECGSVGPRSVEKLEAAIELGRRTLAARAAHKAATVSSPEDLVALMDPLLVGKDRVNRPGFTGDLIP
jgi:DNA repair protein RadC